MHDDDDTEPMVKLKLGEQIGQFLVTKRLGEGGCGVVYKVCYYDKRDERFAMKVESRKIKKVDQLLPLEAQVLKKMQFSPFAVKFIQFAHTTDFRLLVMGLLGPSLSHLQDEQPNYIFSLATVLRVGLQGLQAIGHLHSVYFAHRDVKPGNFAIDQVDCRRVYILDFGLSRHFKRKGEQRIRKKRDRVPFRGTPTYCSPNAHRKMEHGRHDDIWSLIYMLVDFTTGYLPWFRHSRASTGVIKAKLTHMEYMHNCPILFAVILDYLSQLTYYDRPDYVGLERAFVDCLKVRGIRWNQPMDWELDITSKLNRQRQTNKAQMDTGVTAEDSFTNRLTFSSLPDNTIEI